MRDENQFLNNKKHTILIIDDDGDDYFIFKKVLKKEGYNTLYARSGIEGIKVIENKVPDCILIEQNMPKMSGIEVCRNIRQHDFFTHIPIIIRTDYQDKENIFESIEAGADDFIVKSSDYRILLSRIKAMIRIKMIQDKKIEDIKFSNRLIVFSKKINITDDNELISVLKENIENIFGTQIFSIFLYDRNADILELFAHNNPELIKKDIVITRNKKSIMWDVIDNNKKTFIDDFQSSIYFCGKKLYRDNFAISYPLAIDNNVFGVINMNNSNTGDIPEKLYKMAVNIEGHLASALSNSIAFKKLENLSNTDELTQLFNRRYLLNILQNELERAKRYKRNLSCIMIDIDRFKNINDNYGHLYGDFILKKIGNIFKTNCRETDIICRYGGDEFFIILIETSLKRAIAVAEKIRKHIKKHEFNNDNISTLITISLGISSYPEDSIENKKEIIKIADKRLYKAKKSGRNKTVYS